jgi:hypothetical protein
MAGSVCRKVKFGVQSIKSAPGDSEKIKEKTMEKEDSAEGCLERSLQNANNNNIKFGAKIGDLLNTLKSAESEADKVPS